MGLSLSTSLSVGRYASARGPSGVPTPPHSPAFWHHSTYSLINASDTALVTDGAACKSWLDQIHGYSLTQATAGQRPTLKLNWKNGKPALRYVGASSQRQSATAAWLANGGAWTIFIVGARDNDPDLAATNDAWFNIDGTQSHRLQSATVGGTKYVCTVSTNQTLASGNFGFGTSAAYLMWADEGNTGTNAMSFRANGVAKTVTGSRPDSSGITGYTAAGFNGVSFDGYIGEIIGYAGLLSGPQIADVEAHITAWVNWGTF